MKENKKFIFVTGGVMSSLGKGLSAAAIGTLLEARGLRICNVKMDPYINVDPGTMSPYQHGEVFVTDDGAETDLDLGHYERFTSVRMKQKHSFTTGRIYQNVIQRERNGDYLGKTVQVIPHITDEIKRMIWNAVEDTDLAIIEIGGTVGDIESLPFLEAIRQMRLDAGEKNVLFLHLTLVPFIPSSGEMKTKPTQHSVRMLREIGIQPNILLCRCDRPLPQELCTKISRFCDVPVQNVIAAPDVADIYSLPLVFFDQALDQRILDTMGIWTGIAHLEKWRMAIERSMAAKKEVVIGIVGKYVHLTDTYKSLNEALKHGGIPNNTKVRLQFVDSETLTSHEHCVTALGDVDGILVPGGFGSRGVEGKILAIRYARTQEIPFFGICLGMQLAVVEFSRSVLECHDANSREFNPEAKNILIDLMDEQHEVTQKGGTMRLGAQHIVVFKSTLSHKIYGEFTNERHRHRYELNNDLRPKLQDAGLIISGVTEKDNLVEIIEVSDKKHPWFVGVQFHPEFSSTPKKSHPLFKSFVEASISFSSIRIKSDKKEQHSNLDKGIHETSGF